MPVRLSGGPDAIFTPVRRSTSSSRGTPEARAECVVCRNVLGAQCEPTLCLMLCALVAIGALAQAQTATSSSGDLGQTLGSAFAGRRVVRQRRRWLVRKPFTSTAPSTRMRGGEPCRPLISCSWIPTTARRRPSAPRCAWSSMPAVSTSACSASTPSPTNCSATRCSGTSRSRPTIGSCLRSTRYLDGRTGYFFEINPSGAMGDGLIGVRSRAATGGASANKQWDGIWNARVRRTDRGWSAEVELPFRTFNFDADGVAWGINFQRTVRRKNEESLWAGHLRNQGLTPHVECGVAHRPRRSQSGCRSRRQAVRRRHDRR